VPINVIEESHIDVIDEMVKRTRKREGYSPESRF